MCQEYGAFLMVGDAVVLRNRWSSFHSLVKAAVIAHVSGFAALVPYSVHSVPQSNCAPNKESEKVRDGVTK